MKVKINIKKSLKKNASDYYEKGKTAKKKREKLEEEIKKTEKLLKKEEGKPSILKKKVRIKREKRWYERFRWFFTSEGKLVIAGRNAKQNDILYARYLGDNDLFFHADIKGAPATILKGGVTASEKEKQETAQFAASYSSAWKEGYASVDVYAVKKEQVGKYAPGGYVSKGGFTLKGEREWFRDTSLGLVIYVEDGIIKVFPGEKQDAKKGAKTKIVKILPGNEEKGKIAKKIAQLLGADADLDSILQVLPQGKSSIKKMD